MIAVLAAVVALLAAACGSGGEDGDSTEASLPTQTEVGDPVPGGTLVYGLPAETNGWDPTLSQWGPWSLVVARSIFDTLSVFDEDGNIHPNLAESFTPNEDYTEWVVKLRPDVTFHNGEQLTAEVLAQNWNFFRDSPLTQEIFKRVGTWEVRDELELVVRPLDKWVNMPVVFTTQVGVVMAPESLEGPAGERAQHPIGTGAFELEEWAPDSHLTVTRNPEYWQDGYPYLDEIEFRTVTDPQSRASALQSGELDLAMLEDVDQVDQFRDDDDFLLWQDPNAESGEQLVMLNTMQPPLDDVRVRRALAYATDRAGAIEVLSPGREVASGPYRTSSPWYVETEYPGYDLEEASRLVEEYESEVGPIELTLLGSSAVGTAELAQLLKEQWGQVGIDVSIDSSEVAQMIVAIVGGNYQAVIWRQFDSPHPLQESVWWHCDGAKPIGETGLNFARNCNETLTAALDEAREVESREEEVEQYGIVQQELARDVPYVWLSHIEPTVVAGANVVDVFNFTVPDTDLRGMSLQNSSHPLHQVWIAPE